MADSEWEVPVHREGKFMGLKNHRLLDGVEGKQNQGGRFFEDEVVRKGKQQKRIKRSVGQKCQATSKVRIPDWQPITMENMGNGISGKPYWCLSLMRH